MNTCCRRLPGRAHWKVSRHRGADLWHPVLALMIVAALALYAERGYDETTVAEIAERAGPTKRTFFRYFTDKREVLFWGSERLQQQMVAAIEAAPRPPRPLA